MEFTLIDWLIVTALIGHGIHMVLQPCIQFCLDMEFTRNSLEFTLIDWLIVTAFMGHGIQRAAGTSQAHM